MAGCDIIKVMVGWNFVELWRDIIVTFDFAFACKKFIEELCFFKWVIDNFIIVDNRRDIGMNLLEAFSTSVSILVNTFSLSRLSAPFLSCQGP